jgi:hypothetical protein
MFQHTVHSAQRAAQCHLRPGEIDYVMAFGRRYHQAGAVVYYRGQRDIPDEDRRLAICTRLAGTAVILSRDGRTVITVWRNRRSGLRRLRIK